MVFLIFITGFSMRMAQICRFVAKARAIKKLLNAALSS